MQKYLCVVRADGLDWMQRQVTGRPTYVLQLMETADNATFGVTKQRTARTKAKMSGCAADDSRAGVVQRDESTMRSYKQTKRDKRPWRSTSERREKSIRIVAGAESNMQQMFNGGTRRIHWFDSRELGRMAAGQQQ